MLRRLLLSLAIVFVGLGAVLHGAQASTMSAGMAMAADGTEAPPCGGCDGAASDLAACNAVCGTVAALPGLRPFGPPVSVEARPRREARLGESPCSPPDPYPPRVSLA
jgi:hypothetical protein